MFTVQVSSDNWWSPQDGCYIYTARPGPGGHVGDRVTGATGGDGDRCRCWANPLCIRTIHYGSNRCKINTDWAPTVFSDLCRWLIILVMIWYCVTMSQWSFLHPWPGGWQRTRPRTLPGDGVGGGQTTYQNRNNKLCFLYINLHQNHRPMLTEPQIE